MADNRSLKYLTGDEQQKAKEFVLEKLGQTPAVPWAQLTANAKYKIWYVLFRSMPELTARVRNNLKIGA